MQNELAAVSSREQQLTASESAMQQQLTAAVDAYEKVSTACSSAEGEVYRLSSALTDSESQLLVAQQKETQVSSGMLPVHCISTHVHVSIGQMTSV